jgi:histidine triad (HIT) family protein
MAESDPNCLFCRIIAGEVPAEVVRRTEHTLAIRDIDPQAPTHVLVVPLDHHRDAGSVGRSDPPLAGHLLADAAAVAAQEGIDESGYRIVLNTGAGAGQTVFHVHAHVLGGRPLHWPPG